MATLIDGKKVSSVIREGIKNRVRLYRKMFKGSVPNLTVIIVGNNPASQTYVRNKAKAFAECGMRSSIIAMPEDISQTELINKISELNGDPDVNGILVQLPLPPQIEERDVLYSISPEKDVDCFHPVNVGKLVNGSHDFLPCTPAGIMELLRYYGIDPAGKRCTVVGRSNIVGKPVSLLMLEKNATVTICHSKTVNISEMTGSADILIAAVGRAGFIKADMIKEGAVVIDVGINRGQDGKLTGDVAFAEVAEKASAITPVPGGVGPMTITMLLMNTIRAALIQHRHSGRVQRRKGASYTISG